MTKPLREPVKLQPMHTWGLSRRETLAWDIFLFVIMPLVVIGAMLFTI